MNKVRVWLIALGLFASVSLQAQDADSLLTDADTPFTAQDSLNIFTLIDSLLSIDTSLGSQLAIRIGYNSNVLSAGRTLGIDNFGLAPGISYYHSSGLYADVSGYWSKDFVPSYYLTIATAGYMVDFTKHLSLMASYDHYFYNLGDDNAYIPYTNSLSVTPLLEYKPLILSANYSFYFGDQFAHRVMPGISCRLVKRKIIGLDRISISPSFYLLWGNELITTVEYVAPKTPREALDNFRKYGTRFAPVISDHNVTGIMNYTISVPLSISYKNWNLLFTYAYSIPRALPGEALALDNSSYLTGSITYFIDLRRNKKPL